MLEHDITAMPPQPAHLPPCSINPLDTSSSPPLSKSPPRPESLESDDLPHDTISPSILAHDHADTMYLSLPPSDSDSDSEDAPSQRRPAGAPHRRARQRQMNGQLSQKKSIEALLGDMIASGTQCSVADAPLTLSASKPTPSSDQSPSVPVPALAASPPPATTTITSPDPIVTDPSAPIAIDVDVADPDDDEGFHELDPDDDGHDFHAHPSLFRGQYARADEACGMPRWSQLRMAVGCRRAGQQQGTGELGTGVVRARIRKRIGRTRRTARH